MFNLFSRNTLQKSSNLFEDKFTVFDIESVKWKQRVLLLNDQYVYLYSNAAVTNNANFLYYEIVFNRERLYSFIVYHNTLKDETIEVYNKIKIVLNNLEKFITLNKVAAGDHLRAIMNCFRVNTNWTTTHVAARIGYDSFFKDLISISSMEINAQEKPDKLTPLHLAIQSQLISTVKILLDLKPNLDLLDSKNFSILHFAAISTQEILYVILHQPGMFHRILWKNDQGCTPLHLACYVQKFDNVFEFLKFGLTVRMLTLSPPRRRSRSSSTLYRKSSVAEPIDYNKIVKFTEQDFNDLDCQDIFSGGSPLHWVKHKRLMEKLISYRFNLNIKNLNGDTPLHIMTKRSRLKCVITLLCCGANVESQNIFGNSPLHHSVKMNDIILTQTLVVFDANFDAVNFVNESVRHLASKESGYNQEMILYLISSLGAKRCPQNMTNCNPGCSFNGTFEGRYNPNLFETTKNLDKFFKNFQNEQIFNDANARSSAEFNKCKRSNLLSLDGGGVKGLVTIQILMELEKHLQHPINNYFKWIAGTSTGSFIAVFMAVGKTLSQIRSIYFRFKDKVMVGTRPYDSDQFEATIKEELGANLKMYELKTKYNKFVIIPAVLFDRKPMKLHLFRSYESHNQLLDIQDFDPGFSKHPSKDQFVWKACRASGAAPTYFKSFGPFIDGGMIANNPTLDALTEFQFYNNALKFLGRENETEKLDFVLSIGTGKYKVEENEILDISSVYSLNPIDINNNIRYIKQMFNLLVYEICNTENHVVNRSEAFCSAANVPYFRINPPFTEVIELDEPFDFKIVNTLWETKRYMHLMHNEVMQVVDYLEKFTQDLPPMSSKSSRHSRSTSRRSISTRISSIFSMKSSRMSKE